MPDHALRAGFPVMVFSDSGGAANSFTLTDGLRTTRENAPMSIGGPELIRADTGQINPAGGDPLVPGPCLGGGQ